MIIPPKTGADVAIICFVLFPLMATGVVAAVFLWLSWLLRAM